MLSLPETTQKNNCLVRDHDHITGKYRGAVHNTCNLRFRPDKKIPVIIHNFRGYDSRLIIKMMNEDGKVIANNREKFMSMQVGPFKFIDSLQFLSASLDRLVSGLDSFKSVKVLAANRVGDKLIGDKTKLKLLTRKGVFLYEYIDSFDKHDETSLPNIEKFKSSLDGYKGISDKDYEHAKSVWVLCHGCTEMENKNFAQKLLVICFTGNVDESVISPCDVGTYSHQSARSALDHQPLVVDESPMKYE